MRILGAFFAVLFVFINPTMFLSVFNEVEMALMEGITDIFGSEFFTSLANGDVVKRLSSFFSAAIATVTILHIFITAFTLYGLFSCRPSFLRPMLFDVVVSLVFLLSFVVYSLYATWTLNEVGTKRDSERTRRHLRNTYVGAAFLLTYFIWFSITMAAYFDVNKLHADFMYWIVEERSSMRRGRRHVVSVQRSERSSHNSRNSSKTSTRSSRTDQSRPNSAAASLPSKKTSLANNRLSVPL